MAFVPTNHRLVNRLLVILLLVCNLSRAQNLTGQEISLPGKGVRVRTRHLNDSLPKNETRVKAGSEKRADDKRDEPKKTIKNPPKVVAETAEEDEDPENKRPRIFFDFPRYSDQLRTSLIPKGGSVVLKWHIEPKPKPNKTIDIVLEKRDAYTTLLPIASNLTTSTNSFTWEVGVAKRGKKYSTPLNIGDYKLWIFESNKEYLNVEGDIIPASTPVTIFAPIDVSAKFNIKSGTHLLYPWRFGSAVVFFLGFLHLF